MMSREKANNGALLGQSILFAVLLGVIWLDEGASLQGKHIPAMAGALFFIIVNNAFGLFLAPLFLAFRDVQEMLVSIACLSDGSPRIVSSARVGSIFGILFLFPTERGIVLKERASRSYHVGAYFWSKTLSELPRALLVNLIFLLISYFMIELRDGFEYFVSLYLLLMLTTLCSEGLAYIASVPAKDTQAAGAIAPVFLVTSMLFGGFFIDTNAIPEGLSWLGYLSFIKYAFAAVMQNEFSDRVLPVTDECSNPVSPAYAQNGCKASGADVLNYYGMNEFT